MGVRETAAYRDESAAYSRERAFVCLSETFQNVRVINNRNCPLGGEHREALEHSELLPGSRNVCLTNRQIRVGGREWVASAGTASVGRPGACPFASRTLLSVAEGCNDRGNSNQDQGVINQYSQRAIKILGKRERADLVSHGVSPTR